MYKNLITGLALSVALTSSAWGQTTIPNDAAPTCSAASIIDSWFAGRVVTKNGWVNPADSITFPPVVNTACDFYKWGQQMFLWLTTPLGLSLHFPGGWFIFCLLCVILV